MKYSTEEIKMLEDLLEKYKEYIKKNKFETLNSAFNKFYGSFHKLFTTLSSEKIISIDPYGNEYNLTSLKCPDSSTVPYNEEAYTISIRLSHYNALLTHIKTTEILNIENLDPDKIGNIQKLIQFIQWDHLFDPQPLEINTEALNKVLFYYQKDRGQQFILSSIKASVSDVFRYGNEMQNYFSPIILYYNELYKLWIRKEILCLIKLPPELKGKNIKQAHDIITKKIKEFKNPVYIELIGEVLKEDFSEEGEQIRKEIQNMLSNPENDKSKNHKHETEIKPIELLEKSLLDISNISTQTNTIIEKINENKLKIIDEKYSVIEKLIDYVKTNIFGIKRVTNYLIKITDGSEKKERNLELENFIERIKRFENKLIKYKNNTNNEYEYLIVQGEEEVSKIIHKTLATSKHLYKFLIALDEYFKSNLSSPKGIQIELTVFLSFIDKAQASYYEYKKIIEDKDLVTYKLDKAQAT